MLFVMGAQLGWVSDDGLINGRDERFHDMNGMLLLSQKDFLFDKFAGLRTLDVGSFHES